MLQIEKKKTIKNVNREKHHRKINKHAAVRRSEALDHKNGHMKHRHFPARWRYESEWETEALWNYFVKAAAGHLNAVWRWRRRQWSLPSVVTPPSEANGSFYAMWHERLCTASTKWEEKKWLAKQIATRKCTDRRWMVTLNKCIHSIARRIAQV